MALLETKNVTKTYGALLAVSNVSLLIHPGKIHSDTITVLSQGEVIAEGAPEEIQKNEDVKNAYLGGGTV
jgi:ABC-type branched-subunit amino acid transport system ATPase component